ncbi:imidazole glycerol phosphate synthase subunit HisH [Marinicella rhabdoformis]|uniref:imidazole glycerol phosphate synthase subunit HisH n=1 Tax=Marinicella rhabdoformis TaxID=2580566 RepID=UPI0012AEB79F|nr:imidazole glycerol phosphate synthase subunit HisH [Marinicella rhabdoformis]
MTVAKVKSAGTKVAIIDLDSGNLLSIQTAVKEAGFQLQVVQTPDQLDDDVNVLLMPGQGRFAFVASQIDTLNWREFLLDWVGAGRKLIGICVGMQVLFESSEEDPDAEGLALINGSVKRLRHPKAPMVGWAKLNSYKLSMQNQFAYFVNSYAAPDSDYCTAKVVYGDLFCAAVQKNNLYGFQFHPEKSGSFGRELIAYVCEQ